MALIEVRNVSKIYHLGGEEIRDEEAPGASASVPPGKLTAPAGQEVAPS